MKKLMFVLLTFGLAFSLSTSPASAGTKYVINKEDSWSSLRSYVIPAAMDGSMRVVSLLVTTTVDYLYWHAPGDGVYRIAPFMTQVCFNFQTKPGGLQNVWTRPYYFDDDDDYLQDKIVLNGGTPNIDHACHSEVIPVSARKWYRMDQSPGWQVDGHLSLALQPDDNWQQKWGGSATKYFHPNDDPNIGGWYYEDNANWG